jgi:plasmid stability protein
MPSVQIKDVPDETHAVLRQRAAAAHQSLQEYLRGRLIEEASRPTLDEVLNRAAGRSGGTVRLRDAVTTLRSDRARR